MPLPKGIRRTGKKFRAAIWRGKDVVGPSRRTVLEAESDLALLRQGRLCDVLYLEDSTHTFLQAIHIRLHFQAFSISGNSESSAPCGTHTANMLQI